MTDGSPSSTVRTTVGPTAEPPAADELRVTFIGTATVLVEVAGVTLLTDPNFLHQGEHARLGYGLRSERLTEPAMQIADLPPLDAVVLSHHHGDHFDDRAAAELDAEVPIICNRHAAAKLERQGFRSLMALETWESCVVEREDVVVRITSLPGRHAPQPLHLLLPPVMGSMLEVFRSGELLVRTYISGDTLLHDRLCEIPPRFPEIDLGLLHLGGTRILGVTLTMDASQGMAALRLLQPRHAVPIHFDDYGVFTSPLRDFRRAVEAAERLPTEVHFLDRGDSLSLDLA
jgi:L-ascorbate metabolism protein UlaG (beta-lactamase superfamily)